MVRETGMSPASRENLEKKHTDKQSKNKGKNMQPLKNVRHEKFALALFKGMSQKDAAIEAGYSPKWARSTASRLSTNVNILGRMRALQQEAKDDTVADVLERKRRLTEILRARLTDYLTCGPDRDLIDVGPESPNTAALQEVVSRTEYDKDGAGVAVITRVKLHDPVKSIAELNKMEHIYEPEGLGSININIEKMVVDARGKLEDALSRLAIRAREG